MLVGISRSIELMRISEGLAIWTCAATGTKPTPWNVGYLRLATPLCSHLDWWKIQSLPRTATPFC